MRILYLAQRVPYPPDRGDKITTYHEVRYLVQNHEVGVACLADGQEDLANVAELTRLVSFIDAVPHCRERARLRAAAGAVTGTPFTVSYFNERELRLRIKARLSASRFDVILVYSSGMAQFAETASVPRVMQFADLDSQKWQQYAERSRPPMRWIYNLEANRLLQYERQIATTFDHSLVCTRRELEEFQRLIPGARVSCVANGVDLDYFQPINLEKTKNSLIFTGIMDYFPNVDGVVWFCREILPLVRKHISDTTFTICGARPGPAVKSLQQFPGVTVTGRVPDIRPFLAGASICVVPLRIARGIQNKLLEAMAMGLPVVATTPAFDGVEARKGTDLYVADQPQQFAACVVRLLQDDNLRARTALAARAAMERHYRWGIQLSRLEEILKSVARPSRRCDSTQ